MHALTELLRGTYSFTVRIVECLQLNDIGVADDAHNLQLTILCTQSVMIDL